MSKRTFTKQEAEAVLKKNNYCLIHLIPMGANDWGLDRGITYACANCRKEAAEASQREIAAALEVLR